MKNVFQTVILAALCFMGAAQAAYDAKFVPHTNGTSYLSDQYVAQGDSRTVNQLHSFDQPDANGYLYIENVAEYNCAKQTYRVVQSRGYRTWDDVGNELKTPAGAWSSIDAGQQIALNRVCANSTVADAKKYINLRGE